MPRTAEEPEHQTGKQAGVDARLERQSSQGSVAEARVLRVESHPSGAEFDAVLRDAALKSAQKWQFEPAQQAGVAVRVWLPVRIDF